jgi:hypothetical protein
LSSLNARVHHTRLKTSISKLSLLASVGTALLAGCVSPPTTIPAFPNADVLLPVSLDQNDDKISVVDARACCRTASDFTPERLSFSRIGTAKGELEPSSLGVLTAEIDSTAPICILVHGYGFDMERSVEDARVAISRIRRAAGDQPVRYVLFHWPSELEHTIPWPLLPRDIRLKGSRADVAGHYLAWLIGQFPSHQPVCIVGHSLGCRVAACALHLLGDGEAMFSEFSSEDVADRQINAVFVAAAIDHNWLCPGERYGASTSVADEILVLTNSRDSSLLWYPLLKVRPGGALGRAGVSPEDMRKLKFVGSRVRVVAVEDEIGSNHNFRNYMESDSVANLIVSALQPHSEDVETKSRRSHRK